MTLRDALVTATGKLRAVPELREEAAEDATQLLLHVLGISRAALLANSQDELAPPSYTQYEALITRRLRHEPVQYITGEREFYGLPLRVTPAVLIPRNLTEHLVEAVLHELNPDELRPREQSGESLRIVDVGTGSGAIAIALACHLPHARIMALDNSPEALNIATRNLTLNNLQARIRLLHSDLLTPSNTSRHSTPSSPTRPTFPARTGPRLLRRYANSSHPPRSSQTTAASKSTAGLSPRHTPRSNPTACWPSNSAPVSTTPS